MAYDKTYYETEKIIEEALKSGATKLITNQSRSSIKAIKQIKKITVKTKGGNYGS